MKKSKKLRKGFNQVCILPGFTAPKSSKDFEDIFKIEVGVKVQYLENIITKPDTDIHGNKINKTGGRSDIIFAIHKKDVGTYAVKRFQMGGRWIEDVLAKGNYRCHIYPDRIYNYVSWLVEDIDFPEGACCEL